MKQEENYDRSKVKVLNFIRGVSDIDFVEFQELSSGRVKILRYSTFKQRYGLNATHPPPKP